MSNHLIEEGQIVEFEMDEAPERYMIRRINEIEITLVNLNPKNSHSHLKLQKSEIEKKIESNTIKFLSNTRSHNDTVLNELSEEDKAEAERRLKYLLDILNEGVTAFTEKNIQHIIEKTAEDLKEAPPSCGTVRRWHDKYKDADCTISGLFSRKAFRGRPRIQVDERADPIIKRHIKRYFTKNNPSVQGIYDDIEGEILKFNLNNDDSIKLPTYSAVLKRIRKSTYKRISQTRKGKLKFEAEQANNSETIQTTRVLERVEMDHTQLDIYLLYDDTPIVAGRPYLTILIDHFSRMVLGFQLSFENPSFGAASLACINAYLPKTIHKDLGIQFDWPAHGIPENTVIDNGKEFWGKNFQKIESEVGTRVQYCPIRKAWYKSCVERFYGTVRTRVTDGLPGTVKKIGKCAEGYDPKAEAKMTFSEFKVYFLNWLLGDYHNSVINTKNKTPNQLWLESEDYLPVPEQNRIKLLPKLMATAKRTNEGGTLHYKNLDYSSGFLKDFHARDGRKKVTFKYNPFDLGCILIYDTLNKAYIPIDHEDQDYSKNLSLWEHKRISDRIRKEGKDINNSEARNLAKITCAEIREEVRNKNLKRKKQESMAQAARAEKIGIEQIEISQLTTTEEPTSCDDLMFDIDLEADTWDVECQ